MARSHVGRMSAGWFRSTSVTLRPDGESAASPIRTAVSREGEQIASSQGDRARRCRARVPVDGAPRNTVTPADFICTEPQLISELVNASTTTWPAYRSLQRSLSLHVTSRGRERLDVFAPTMDWTQGSGGSELTSSHVTADSAPYESRR